MKRTLLPLLVGVTFGALAAFAQNAGSSEQTPAADRDLLKPGDKVPELMVAEWVKGAPVSGFEPGKVYVVEFWATWCGPCIMNIPHLNELQQKYAKDGLVVIGMTNPDLDVNAPRGGRPENNTLEQVRKFVEKQGERMNYRVAYDTPNRDTYKRMMPPNSGIPHAFVIGRDGRLVASDHPVYLDFVIERLMAGTWDQARDYPQLARSKHLASTLASTEDYAEFKRGCEELEKNFPALAEQWTSVKFAKALNAADLPAVASAAHKMVNQARKSNAVLPLAYIAFKTSRDIVATMRSSAAGLLLPGSGEQMIELAREMAVAADEVAKGEDGYAKGALAELAYYDRNNARAVELQTKAIELMEHPMLKEIEGKRLAEYQRALETQRLIEQAEAERKQQEKQ
ncbi:MAG: TlpA family protein disulfide reductase [Opitutae bacterium]|nr:TlpA family protein disulfide reductase [Opitutae bacterium]